jgi:hypothetical protein
MQPAADRGVDPDGPVADAASRPTDGGITGWTPPPWSADAAAAEKGRLVGWAEWAASTTFSSTGLTSGYDKQEVDAFRRAVRDTFLGVRNPPVRSDDVRPGQWFSTHRRGYDKPQVDLFLEIASIRLAAMESTAKVTVVYESLFGNTRKVAQAISDGVRGAYPDAHVECVAVGRASAELISSTDLLIVGGPTHLCRVTTDFSRKRHISRAKKAEAKGEPPHELEPDAEGPGLREWFYLMWQAKGWSHAAAFDTRRGAALVGAGSGIARKLCGHGYELVRGPGLGDGPQLGGHGHELVMNPAGFILDSAFGPLRAGEIERAREWGAQLVRRSVAYPEGWAIWHSLEGNE